MSRLVPPSVKYKQSFLKAHNEFITTDKNYIARYKTGQSFAEFVRQQKNHAKGKDLPPGWVPDSIFWLVDKGKFIGTISIRHRLNDNLRRIGGHIGYEVRPSERRKGYGTQILRLGLRKAAALGIKNALLTCDVSNVGSRKIIESAGGIKQLKKTSGKFHFLVSTRQ